jgi:alpha-L-fucosidase 2
MMMEANFGYTVAVAEMLLQSHEEDDERNPILRLLPALSGAWPTGQAGGLRARGGFSVDIAWAEGHLVEAFISSSKDRMCALADPENALDVSAESTRDLKTALLHFCVPAGHPVRIFPQNTMRIN